MGLPGDGPGQQRLAGPGGARQQHAVGHATAQTPIALRAFQEVDDLGKFRLGLVDAGDVGEGHADLFGVHPPGLAAAEVPEASEAPARAGGPTRQ